MQSALDIVHGLSDSQVVAVVKELFNDVYMEISYDDVQNNSAMTIEVAGLVGLSEEALGSKLSASESARLGRLVLEQFALDPELAPFVRSAYEKIEQSDNLIIGEILALGVVINLTLLVATTEVQAQREVGGNITWNVTKKQATPEVIKAIIEPIVGAAKSFFTVT